jgi:hypothetical protein
MHTVYIKYILHDLLCDIIYILYINLDVIILFYMHYLYIILGIISFSNQYSWFLSYIVMHNI